MPRVANKPSVESILNTVIDAVIAIDDEGVIQCVNPAAQTIFGYTSAEMIGKNVSILMPAPYGREHDGHIKSYLRTGQAKVIGVGRETFGQKKDGTIFPIYLGVSEGRREGSRRFFTGVIRDITEHRQLEQAVVESAKKERQKLGRELHDGIAQHLVSTAIVAKLLEKRLAKESPAVAVELKRVVGMVNEAVSRTRRLAQGLYDLEINSEDMASLIKRFARDTEKAFGISVDIDLASDVRISDDVTAAHLYRIAREAVSNAVKHGHCKNIHISLTRKSDREARFMIESDGKRFSRPVKSEGLGLSIMRSRAATLKASLGVAPGTKSGTVVTCVFPIGS